MLKYNIFLSFIIYNYNIPASKCYVTDVLTDFLDIKCSGPSFQESIFNVVDFMVFIAASAMLIVIVLTIAVVISMTPQVSPPGRPVTVKSPVLFSIPMS